MCRHLSARTTVKFFHAHSGNVDKDTAVITVLQLLVLKQKQNLHAEILTNFS